MYQAAISLYKIRPVHHRGRAKAVGYYRNPAATVQAFAGGWLRTGDEVVEDEDGLLRFVDRRKDVINRGGLKVASAAVEAVLYRVSAVSQQQRNRGVDFHAAQTLGNEDFAEHGT